MEPCPRVCPIMRRTTIKFCTGKLCLTPVFSFLSADSFVHVFSAFPADSSCSGIFSDHVPLLFLLPVVAHGRRKLSGYRKLTSGSRKSQSGHKIPLHFSLSCHNIIPDSPFPSIRRHHHPHHHAHHKHHGQLANAYLTPVSDLSAGYCCC